MVLGVDFALFFATVPAEFAVRAGWRTPVVGVIGGVVRGVGVGVGVGVGIGIGVVASVDVSLAVGRFTRLGVL